MTAKGHSKTELRWKSRSSRSFSNLPSASEALLIPKKSSGSVSRWAGWSLVADAKIETWSNLPPDVREHPIGRMRDWTISIADLNQLRL
jgi:hypothetical protein